jgi:hypothetical protein
VLTALAQSPRRALRSIGDLRAPRKMARSATIRMRFLVLWRPISAPRNLAPLPRPARRDRAPARRSRSPWAPARAVDNRVFELAPSTRMGCISHGEPSPSLLSDHRPGAPHAPGFLLLRGERRRCACPQARRRPQDARSRPLRVSARPPERMAPLPGAGPRRTRQPAGKGASVRQWRETHYSAKLRLTANARLSLSLKRSLLGQLSPEALDLSMARKLLRRVAPISINGTVKPPRRRPNAELRSREHLTEPEVERLMTAAGDNRYGHRDRTFWHFVTACGQPSWWRCVGRMLILRRASSTHPRQERLTVDASTRRDRASRAAKATAGQPEVSLTIRLGARCAIHDGRLSQDDGQARQICGL